MTELGLRVFYANAPQPVRDRIVEITLALGLPADDPRLTVMLLQFAPVEHGATGLERLKRFVHRTDLSADWRTSLAIAAWGLGAFPISGTLALSAAAELRAQGRLGTLVPGAEHGLVGLRGARRHPGRPGRWPSRASRWPGRPAWARGCWAAT